MIKLEIGKNYIGCFLGDAAADRGLGMIYNGGDSWTARKPRIADMTKDSAETTAKVLTYVIQRCEMGGIR